MKLFNSLTRSKEEFKPMDPNEVKMYSCGPTVYNYFHIGNARPFIVFDVLRRYMEYRGYKVKFVQNFTDIDDKVINKANEEGVTYKDIAEKYIEEYFVDAKGLGIHPATIHPKATDNIDAIIDIVSTLIEKGYAYESEGDVYYRALKFKDYGKLSKQPIEDLVAGARISVGEKKEEATDFALWKAAKPGEPSWDSPWGKGRPGWHIECSAMANRYLGKTIDIHSGGVDLTFPHHENEIAQSEAANGCQFANYWLHNAFLNIDNKKMSKSLGNFFTVRDIAEEFDYEVIRFFMLSAHYRSPINFSKALMESAKSGLDRVYNCLNTLEFLKTSAEDRELSESEKALISQLDTLKKKYIDAMDDDLNTADAISVIFEIVSEVNKNITAESKSSVNIIDESYALIKELGGVLGLFQKSAENSVDDEVEQILAERKLARENKDWAKSDELRDKLKAMGITVKDTPAGQQITRD